MKKGAELVLETVRQIRDDGYQLRLQDDASELKAAPKLFKEDCQILNNLTISSNLYNEEVKNSRFVQWYRRILFWS